MTFALFLESKEGRVGVWLLICVFLLGTWLWVYFLVPETKGKPLEEVLKLFKRKQHLSFVDFRDNNAE